MSERFTFVGAGITPANKKDATAYMRGYREGADRSFEEIELEKTEGEKEAIELLNYFLQQEFSGLGIADMPELTSEQFHIVPIEELRNNSQNGSLHGIYLPKENATVVGRSPSKLPIQHYKTIFHEGTHAVSHSKFWVGVSRNKVDIKNYRTGYGAIGKNTDEENGRVRFAAFNEGIVETTVERMFHRGNKLIQKDLAVSQEDIEKVRFSYPTFRAIVKTICGGLARYSGKTSIEHWQNMERGQFTGEMMHLRDIEYAYGKGALRILDALQLDPDATVEEKDETTKTRNKQVLEFFESYTLPDGEREDVRGELAREILGEEDFEKYCL
jgi:hypothetical protein